MKDKRKNLKMCPELHKDLKVMAAQNGVTLEQQINNMREMFKNLPEKPFEHYRKSIFPLKMTKTIIKEELLHYFRGDEIELSIIPEDEIPLNFLIEVIENDAREELREWFIDELGEAPEANDLRKKWGINQG